MSASKRTFISGSTAKAIEAYFAANINKILSEAGFDVDAVSIGGKYNREGILLELGFMPKNTSISDAKAFVVDRHIDNHDCRLLEKQADDPIAKAVKLTGLTHKQVSAYVKGLPAKLKCGTVYHTEKDKYFLVGSKDDKFLVVRRSDKKVMNLSKDQFKKLRKAK